MCKVMEDMREVAAREAERRLITEIVHPSIGVGLSHEQIAESVGITVDQVCEIAGTKGA